MNCSFCGKSKEKCYSLVAGPGVFICDECTNLSVSMIGESRGGKAAGPIGLIDEYTESILQQPHMYTGPDAAALDSVLWILFVLRTELSMPEQCDGDGNPTSGQLRRLTRIIRKKHDIGGSGAAFATLEKKYGEDIYPNRKEPVFSKWMSYYEDCFAAVKRYCNDKSLGEKERDEEVAQEKEVEMAKEEKRKTRQELLEEIAEQYGEPTDEAETRARQIALDSLDMNTTFVSGREHSMAWSIATVVAVQLRSLRYEADDAARKEVETRSKSERKKIRKELRAPDYLASLVRDAAEMLDDKGETIDANVLRDAATVLDVSFEKVK